MKKRFTTRAIQPVAALLVCGWGVGSPHVFAQKNTAPSSTQPPAASQPKSPQDSNPFPEDTNSVPVIPSINSSAPPAPDATDYPPVSLPGTDGDPVKSPDDAASVTEESGSSSSSAGLDNLRPPPEEEQQGKHGRGGAPDQPHTESAKDDENVGSYYLDQKNWRAALSRFESAVVLDPENPEVYWGLAESQRHLGNYAEAKGNYLKVVEYDPDSKHGKEAKRILQDPEMANAKAVAASASTNRQP